ncbi:thioredoxin-disulfide reductase [Desulfonatronum thioautotrophicum]|uniref:thioredoxin-disulfide reductase n=1 Tax=Desulfonatronum thioautotrophicum TaxID=617001 RepID=UPI0005EACEA5|nr:thioredoxin-disulfide reductase [Desulfonatronum thioautotrophicum]
MADLTIHDLIIIGSGPGGLTAGIYAQRAALHTVLIEKGVPGGQLNNTDTIENWPGTKSIQGTALAEAMAEHARSCGLEILNREVLEVEPGLDAHTVRLDDGSELHALAVILACGGHPRQLGIPGETENYGKGVSYCAVCDGFFFRGKQVVVVGGGDSALEESLFLAKISKEVHIVHRRDTFRAGMILQKRIRSEPRVILHMDSVVTAITADDSGVTGVELKNVQNAATHHLDADGVFVFIGFEPNKKLVPAGVKMNTDGFVVTNEKCETNIPGFYVIGDLREKYVKQIVTAAAEGCTAAQVVARYVEDRKARERIT